MPMSCTLIAARSFGAAVTAILNLRGRYENSGWNVDHWRMISDQRRGSSTSSAGGAGEVIGGDVADAIAAGLDACISTSARSARMSGTSASFGQLYWMFWRVVKWP